MLELPKAPNGTNDIHPFETKNTHWELVKEIFAAGAELPEGERQAFLVAACGDDTQLFSEVQHLLLHHRRLDGFLDSPLVSSTASLGCLAVGDIICHRFRIVRFVGEGGMGEVYEAEDSLVGERIAIKTIRPEIAGLPGLAERLRREVQLSRQVSHINVCRVFELWEHQLVGGAKISFLSMELLQGETLAQRIASNGPMRPNEALPLIRQAAAGLSEIHRAGIIHRDLKPSNLYLVDNPDKTCRVVVTDFGLARPCQASDRAKTHSGRWFGTPAYMAPEQFESGDASFASDIYSFGVTIFEMVTGRSHPLTVPSSVNPVLSDCWDRAIEKCLSRKPDERPTTASSVVKLIEGGQGGRRHLLLKWVAALLLLSFGVAGALYAWGHRSNGLLAGLLNASSTNNHGRQAADMLPERLENETGIYDTPALSGDGRTVVFSSDRSGNGDLDIWAKTVETNSYRQLTGPGADEVEPAISFDGRMVAYRSERNGGAIYTNSIFGGQEKLLSPLGHNPRFSPQGEKIAFWTGDTGTLQVPSAKTFVVNAGGGEPVPILSGFADVRFPVWSPDGKYLLVTASRDRNVPPREALDWWIVPANGGAPPRKTGFWEKARAAKITPFSCPPFWADGRIVFSVKQGEAANIWQVSATDAGILGDTETLTQGTVPSAYPWALNNGATAFAVHDARINIWSISLAGSHHDLTRVTSAERYDLVPRVAEDGSQMLITRAIGPDFLTWLKDLRTKSERQLTLVPNHATAAFDAGHANVAFSAYAEGKRPISILTLATGAVTTVCADCGPVIAWDRKGAIFYRAGEPSAIYTLDPAHGGAGKILARAPLALTDAALSPDGTRVALVANQNPERARIYVANIRGGLADPWQKWILVDREDVLETKPRWSEDGGTLYFYSNRDGFGCIWAQKVGLDGGLRDLPFAIMHFHTARLRSSYIAHVSFNLSVARGKLFLDLDELSTSMWIQHARKSVAQ